MTTERDNLVATNIQVGLLIAELRSFMAVSASALRSFDSATQVQATIVTAALEHHLDELFGWSAQHRGAGLPLRDGPPTMGITLQMLPAHLPGLPSQLQRLVREARQLETALAGDAGAVIASRIAA
ncbi:MAG: hypothetical protein QF797_03490 [Alphaproteobacteria bacterium]|jgi:hypothetical protein|nr:hypothetical protein [Rhodospirillaceae bacterium]MDP6404249.1 hypothetical protein [Alphaproteobacteria bacterium]MDP6620971.1 hypothetical protein [Alphaproteobacteria bacterium]|tara:strand:- start:950 stop:1327 length:378 start_codon:yes stop_codon:yes gene_type:complete